MTHARRHSDLMYRLEMLLIRARDVVRSPAGVLLEAGLRPGMTVLDFGCGPGGFSLAAAQLVGPAGRVYALDIRPLALERVRRVAARRGLENVEALSGNRVTDVPEESVDMALLYDVLHGQTQADGVAAILAAIRRVLKPKGVLSVSDHHLKEEALLAAVIGGGRFRLADLSRRTLQFAKASTLEVAP